MGEAQILFKTKQGGFEKIAYWGTLVNLGSMVCKGPWPEKLNEVG